MPKIADIQETPNPNAVKFILKEAVSYGTSHSFDSIEKAEDDQLAKSLFEIGLPFVWRWLTSAKILCAT